MIADVGDMLNVSGRRIATPLAPPSPGSTPMITPSTMPTTITMMLKGCSDDREAMKQISDFFHFLARPTDAIRSV